MSNLPSQSAVNHNDGNDEQTNTNPLSTINSRITSPLILKRQQTNETKLANNQAYDEIHDVQTRHSSMKKTNSDNSDTKNSSGQVQSKLNSSHQLMQGNYYDQTRFDIDYSSASTFQSEPVLIDINLEDYKKTITPVSTSRNSSNKNRASSPPFGDTSESIQQGIAQSAGILLELNKKQQPYNKTSMKNNNNKSDERALINHIPKDDDGDDDDDDEDNNKQRSLSSTSDCSTSDSCREQNEKINSECNIPYEKLSNDEDDDDAPEQSKKPLSESTTLLNKNHSSTYGTQTTTNVPGERSKCLSTNGYNSHGSSITTKSSSDNSGSIRTNSGSDNDEESDEEPYNNSTLSNHSVSMSRTNDTSIKSVNKSNDIETSRYSDRLPYSNEQTIYQSVRSNTTRSEQIDNNDEHHLQVPRLKQLPNDDPNGNNNEKLNSGTDYNTLPYASKWSSQQSSNNLFTSVHQNRNPIENNDQQQQSNLSSNNSRQNQTRATKKRKQLQQKEIIRTELIPGHRGDLDVDELVMFIDGDASKQQQNSVPLRLTDTNKPRLSAKVNPLIDPNSNKTSSKKKSRKSIKILQQSISSANNNENKTSNYTLPIEQDIQTVDFIDHDDQTTATHFIVDQANQSLRQRNLSIDNNDADDITNRISLPNNNDESHLNIVDNHSTNDSNPTNNKPSLPDWFEQTKSTFLQNDDDGDIYPLPPKIEQHSNSEIISEPFVTVTHRRRPIKERRQDNNPLSRASRCPPSSSSITNDKRRAPPTSQNGPTPPTTRQGLSNTKPSISSTTTKEKNSNPTPTVRVPSLAAPLSSVPNPVNEQSIEKQQLSPRLSSHSSSSSVSSLLKRQSKAPPVVFVNKSIDIELNDVSFGFDLDSTKLNKSSDNINKQLPTTYKKDVDHATISTSTQTISTQSNEISSDSIPSTSIPNLTERSFQQQQRSNPGPQFYSGPDMGQQHHTYPLQPPVPQSPYIDPVLLLQYQQRLANYSQQVAYMNLLRTHYLSQQPQYVLLPSTYPTRNETDPDNETTSMPTVYPTTPTIYPSQYFYPDQQPVIPTPTDYFQPTASPSLVVDIKPEQNDIDYDDNNDENSAKLYHRTTHQSSSDIMSNALQLVYSQQRRNAQTDRFNLDDLTAYLAMKWTETVDHYEQGDSRILLIDEQ